MGCDIHVYVERLHPAKGWVPVDPPKTRPKRSSPPVWGDWGRWREPDSPLKQLADTALELVDIIPEVANCWAFGRDYEAFAQLAGVRSHFGQDPSYIPPRDVPRDISPQLRVQGYVESDAWNTDWHTPHWYSLGELVEGCRAGELRERRIRQLRDELKKIAKRYDLPNRKVRTVFWFDN